MSFLCHAATFFPYRFLLFLFVCFLFPVWRPLLADWALCCMLVVVMSQFEYSQTLNRTMGIPFNKGKVEPTHPQSCFISLHPRQTNTHVHDSKPQPGPEGQNVALSEPHQAFLCVLPELSNISQEKRKCVLVPAEASLPRLKWTDMYLPSFPLLKMTPR